MSIVRGLVLSSPSPQHERHAPALFSGKLKPPRGRHRQADQFSDHNGEPTEGQSFLYSRKDLFIPVAFAENRAIRMKTGLRHGGEKEVGARHAPENLAFRPGRDACDEQCRRSPIDGPSPAAGDLMQRAEGEASARQCPINLADAERQDLP